MWRRGLLGFGALALVAGILLSRRDARTPAPATPGEERVARGPRVTPEGWTPSWTGQRGVAGRRIGGRVTAGDAGVAAVVRLRLVEDTGAVLVEVATGGDGRFDLGVLPAAWYEVSAQAAHRLGAAVMVDLRDPAASGEVELRLAPCATRVYGTIRDASGGVIAGARIRSLHALTTTDARGDYEICVARGWAPIEASAESYGSASETVQAAGRTRVDLLLTPEAVIAGLVLDAGEPAAGARVSATSYDGRGRSVVAGTDGRFRLDGLPAGGYHVAARREDRGASAYVSLARAGTVEEGLVLELAPLGVLRGRVMAGDAPVAGARVSLQARDLNGGQWSAVSQADGRFVVAHAGRGALFVGVEDYELISPFAVDAAPAREVVVAVKPLARVRGVIRRGGRPAIGANIGASRGTVWRHATSGVDGRFEVGGLQAGSWRISADSRERDAMAVTRSVDISDGEIRELDLALELDGSIAGFLVDQGGAPVGGAVVTFELAVPGDWGTDVTAADGTFRAGGLSGGGRYNVRVSSGGADLPLILGNEGFAVADGSTHLEGVRIAVRLDRLSVAGMVVRAGMPVADVRVEALAPDTDPRWGLQALARGLSRADGRFEITVVGAGDYQVVARASDGSEAVVVAAAGSRDVRLELPGAGAIAGTAVGFAVLDQVLIAGERHQTVARVGDGVFEARDLPPGRYTVQAVAGGESDAVETSVEPGGVARVVLRRGSSARVAGVVRSLVSHEAIAGAACGWRARGMVEDFARVASDEQGRFVLDVPAAREVTIYCSVENGIGTRQAVVAAGESPSLEILVYFHRGYYGSRAGLSPSDRVLTVDGIDVSSLDESMVGMILDDHEPGVPYTVTVLRDGKPVPVEIRNKPYGR